VAVAANIVSEVAYYAVPASLGIRPFLIAVPAVVILQLITSRLLGRHVGAIVAGVLGTLLTGAIVTCLLLLSFIAFRQTLKLRFPRLHPGWPAVTTYLNWVSIALLVYAGYGIWTTDALHPLGAGSGESSGQPGPNMYVLMLDGYPRADTLAAWGHDIGEFEAAIEELGFVVSSSSHSNYTNTWASLASMADLRHVDTGVFDGPLPSDSIQHRVLARIFNEGRAWSILRGHGYEIVSTEGVAADLALHSADTTVGSWPPNGFEMELLRHSPLSRLGIVKDWVVDAHRSRVVGQLAAVANLSTDAPVFVWAHVTSPHAPAVFQRDGRRLDHPCWPVDCPFFMAQAASMGIDEQELEARLGEQTAYVNGLVLDAVRRIVDADSSAVIVILSDHGARHSARGDEYFRSFFAARTPGHPNLFADDAGMIATFAELLNAYLDADVVVPDDSKQFLTVGSLLELVEWQSE
jgi:hypothetical protein